MGGPVQRHLVVRRAFRSGGLAVLGVLALGLAAATLTSTVRRRDDGFGAGGGGGAEDPGILPPSTPAPTGDPITLPIPDWLVLAVIVVGGLLALVYLLTHIREAAMTIAAFAVMVGFVFALVWLLAELFPLGTPSMGDMGGFAFGGVSGEFAGDEGTATPIVLLVALLGVVVLGVAVALRSSGEEELPEGEEPEAALDTAATREMGRTAGRAADRLEGAADVDNQVYRAWREMTDLLDVPEPDATTPGEFAAAATAAGMAGEDVSELTRLFEDVRYGDAEADETRERRATTVFRRIERTYAPEE